MARPRVIVADTDESYVIPLQKKFAELFADKIDLEIITDKDYFNQLFSLSQHADILLVSDTLYNSGLKKHDIRHLMILSERRTNSTFAACLNIQVCGRFLMKLQADARIRFMPNRMPEKKQRSY